MAVPKTKFTREFKARAVKMVTTHESVFTVARKLGLSAHRLWHWKAESLCARRKRILAAADRCPPLWEPNLADYIRMANVIIEIKALRHETNVFFYSCPALEFQEDAQGRRILTAEFRRG